MRDYDAFRVAGVAVNGVRESGSRFPTSYWFTMEAWRRTAVIVSVGCRSGAGSF